jgi:hypothetical protein
VIIPESYSLHINCGGKLITSNKSLTYVNDSNEIGPASFHRSGSNWALSNTGHFFDSSLVDYYTWSNQTNLAMENSELYMDARVSPLSLTYYGFCLGNGNYTVNLHFAEIMFTDDQTYNSLGRRIFDIYIQVHDLVILFLSSTCLVLNKPPLIILNHLFFDIEGKVGTEGFQYRKRSRWSG